MKLHEKIGVITMTGSVVLLVLLFALSDTKYAHSLYSTCDSRYDIGGFNFLMNCLSLYGFELKYLLVLCVILFCIGFLWYKEILKIPNKIKDTNNDKAT